VSDSASGAPPERAAEERGPVDPATAAGASETVAPGAPAPGAREVPRTRTGTAFKTLVAGAIVLILLLVFILENTERVKISYFGASGHLPLGVALLIAAIGGALLIGIVGTARILQLRRHVRHQR
jgi:uncharacterized integral membrane protein